MKILITGGTGFLGTYLTRELIQQGEIIVRVADIKEASQPIQGVEYYIGDIRSSDFCKKICANVHAIYNFASMPSIAHGKIKDYYSVNVTALENLLKAALESDITKILHMSSSTVYGIPEVCPISENAPLKPIGNYSRSKLQAENTCLQYRERGLNINIIRPRVILGPGRIGIFSILFDRIIRDQFIPMIGNGRNLFQFTPVKDLAEASVKVMNALNNEIINIGCQKILSIREELSMLINKAESSSKFLSIQPILARYALQFAVWAGVSPLINDQFCIAHKNFILDTSKAQKLLGLVPSQTNFETLFLAFQWYKEQRDIIGSQYSGWAGLLGKFRHSKIGAYQK